MNEVLKLEHIQKYYGSKLSIPGSGYPQSAMGYRQNGG